METNELEAIVLQVEQALAGPKSFVESSDQHERLGPKFRRGFIWPNTHTTNSSLSPSALNTETASPLPSPPSMLQNNQQVQDALRKYRNHIKVQTPYDIERLRLWTNDHPNQPFVRSVIRSLKEGFWPLDEGKWSFKEDDGYMDNYSKDPLDLDAVRRYRDKEIANGHWSPPISELLPGMKTSPLFVVWQGIDKVKPRVIMDHTGSGLNDGIPREAAKVHYDDMRSFGQTMRNARNSSHGRRLVTFKSDVSGAFLTLPAHPIWQLRQVVHVDGIMRLVRCLILGCRGSPLLWCAFSSLLCWIAIKKLENDGLHVYMDDFFGWDFVDNLVFYHGRRRPRKQVNLLILWD